VRSGLHQAEKILARRICGRLPARVRARLLALAGTADGDEGEADPGPLPLIKASAGNVSLASMLTEISRLESVRAVGLPAGLFADVAPKVVAGWPADGSPARPGPGQGSCGVITARPSILPSRSCA